MRVGLALFIMMTMVFGHVKVGGSEQLISMALPLCASG